MRRLSKLLVTAATLALAALSQQGVATPSGGDSSSDVPGGFDALVHQSQGVVVRVPLDSQGRENTNAAELRFYQGKDTPTKATDPGTVWSQSVDPGKAPVVLGTNAPGQLDPRKDSSTWGWYDWCGYGWAYPYYYSYYNPTFYWNSYWYYYSYAWYWDYGYYGPYYWPYRYYYYTWWY